MVIENKIKRSLTGLHIFFIFAILFTGCLLDKDDSTEQKVKEYTISGTVNGTDGVTVKLSGDASDSLVVSTEGGTYSFTVAEGGNYTVTPSKELYTFSPVSKSFTNITSDQIQAFIATLNTYTISGTVNGTDGVTIKLSGDASDSLVVSTDGGTYSFTIAESGNYTVTPSKENYTFSPINKSFTNISSDQIQAFTATLNTYTISGTVTGASGVTVILSGDASDSLVVSTDGGGYSFTVKEGGNYTVTPFKGHYTFTPASWSFNNVLSDQMRSFTATLNTFTISGTVTGTDGVTVKLSGDAFDSLVVSTDGGTYSFTVAEGGNYTVTPSKDVYSFNPENVTFNNVITDQTQDFTAVRKDITPPVITHTPIDYGIVGEEILVSVNVTDDIQISWVNLNYRVEGSGDFITVLMDIQGDEFSAVIPGNEVSLAGIEYYIEANDGTNSSVSPESGVHTISIYELSWSVFLIINEDAGSETLADTLEFGISPGATDSIDTSLGEIELPPRPPAGIFDVRFTGESTGNGLRKDIRRSSASEKVYIINIQRAAGGDITVSWGSLPHGTFTLQDMLNGILFDIDMKTSNEFIITDSGVIQIKIIVVLSAE